ncbi:MAG: CDP-diacylglycerol--serine O-phosphatidyltransferase, partial [Methylophilaceae bacterium]|nr:CDP-diacylglycerol--serine O-phosphatidyltransferase [Methylophilaceae bacterium]
MADKNGKPHTPLLKHGIYLLPNLLTSAALFAGFYAIVQAMNANFDAAAIAIFIAMVMDSLDGRVARLTNTQSAFGAQYDSLSDMVSFGVAPALVLYVWALKPLHKLGWIAAFVYCACVALRLARFNTQHSEDDDKYHFRGLPSPAAAALLAGFVWVAQEYGLNGQTTLLGVFHMKWVAWCMTVFASTSMVNDLRYYSGKSINLKDSVPFVVILGVVLVLVLISYSPPEVLFLVAVLYALSGYVHLIRQKYRRWKSKVA